MFIPTQKWMSIALVFLHIIILVNDQMAVPMYPGPPAAMFGPGYFMPVPPPPPPPPPPPVFFMPPPVAIRIHRVTTTTPTTTTVTTPKSTDSSREILVPGVAIPYPVPMGPIAVPAIPPPLSCAARPRPPKCPACPPCSCLPCTPSFFSYCSPCHQKCRCKEGDTPPRPLPVNMPIPIPQPMPMPMPQPFPMPPMMGAPPVIVVPFPPMMQPSKWPRPGSNPKDSWQENSDKKYSESCSDDNSRSNEVRYRRYHRRRKVPHNSRRNHRSEMDPGSVKPILTWRTHDGEVKYKTRLSVNEAESLLNKDKSLEMENSAIYDGSTIQADIASEKVILIDEPKEGPETRSERKQQLYLQKIPAKQPLKTGKKEIIFNPPYQKKISNLSISFDVD